MMIRNMISVSLYIYMHYTVCNSHEYQTLKALKLVRVET